MKAIIFPILPQSATYELLKGFSIFFQVRVAKMITYLGKVGGILAIWTWGKRKIKGGVHRWHFGVLLFLCMVSQPIEARVLITSIPKSGTHLLCKTIEAVTRTSVKNEDIHHTYDRVIDFAKANPDVPIVLIVRDLRDVCLSYVHYVSLQIQRHPEPKYYYLFGEFRRSDDVLAALIPMWPKMSVEEKLTAVLEANSLAPCDIANFFRVAAILSELPNVTLVKFENLVGPEGGGDLNLQYREIEKIASVYNISLSQPQIKRIRDGLFGKAPNSRWNTTFRSGQIGSWKAVYTPQHIATFKERFNDYLYFFGYIDHEDWETL